MTTSLVNVKLILATSLTVMSLVFAFGALRNRTISVTSSSSSSMLGKAMTTRTLTTKAIVAVTTLADRESAVKLSRDLVERKLAACVNIIPSVTSVYRWKSNVETSEELMLFMKTTRERYDALQSFIRANHPYEVPELIQLNIEDGLPAYLKWIVDETS